MLKQKEFIDLGKVVKNKNLSFWGKTKKIVGEGWKNVKIAATGRSKSKVEHEFYKTHCNPNQNEVEEALAKKLNNDRFGNSRISYAASPKYSAFRSDGHPFPKDLEHAKYINNKKLAEMGTGKLLQEAGKNTKDTVKNVINHPGNIVSEATSVVDEAAHNPVSGTIMLGTGAIPMAILGPGGYSTSLAVGAGKPLSKAVKKIPYVGGAIKAADKVGYVSGPVSDLLHVKEGGELLGRGINNVIGKGGLIRKGLRIDKTPEYMKLNPEIRGHLDENIYRSAVLNNKRKLKGYYNNI